MERRSFLTLTASGIAAGTAGAGCSPARDRMRSDTSVTTAGDRSKYLDRMLRELVTAIGPHPVGSPAYHKAAEVVKTELERSLPDVAYDTFTFDRWSLVSEPELTIANRWIEAFPAHGCNGTGPEGFSGVLTKSEERTDEYIAVDTQTGRVGGYLYPFELGNARPRPYYSFGKEPNCPPILNIGSQDRAILDAAVSERSPVRFVFETTFDPNTTTMNVVGTLPGETTDEILLIAHLDTVYSAPGANDNTATVIAMLMLAHTLKDAEPQKTVRFLFTDGEEYGKLGAINYAEGRRRAGTFGAIKFVFNFDSFTWGHNLDIYSRDTELITGLTGLDRQHNPRGVPVIHDHDGFWLDADPFRDPGVRALSVTSNGFDVFTFCWHRPNDIPANVSHDCVEICYKIFLGMLERVNEM